MTRPMPGPPTHDRYARPHRQFADERCSTCYSPGWTLPKWLADAECAAEYWMWAAASERVRAFIAISRKPGESVTANLDFQRAFHEQVTWHRFATRPHYDEVNT